jgi:hypothetical protein
VRFDSICKNNQLGRMRFCIPIQWNGSNKIVVEKGIRNILLMYCREVPNSRNLFEFLLYNVTNNIICYIV